MKKVLVVIICVVAVLFIAAAVYFFVSMSSTINSLNNRISEYESQAEVDKYFTQAPAQTEENHDAEIAELQTLYDQKESLINGYADKAKDIKALYGENESFGEFYSYASESYETAQRMYLSIINDETGEVAKEWFSAGLCALYDTYYNEKVQMLISIKGEIESLKNSFDDEKHTRIRVKLGMISEMEIPS